MVDVPASYVWLLEGKSHYIIIFPLYLYIYVYQSPLHAHCGWLIPQLEIMIFQWYSKPYLQLYHTNIPLYPIVSPFLLAKSPYIPMIFPLLSTWRVFQVNILHPNKNGAALSSRFAAPRACELRNWAYWTIPKTPKTGFSPNQNGTLIQKTQNLICFGTAIIEMFHSRI